MSDTVRATMLQHRTKQFTVPQGSSSIASIGSVWFQVYNTFVVL